MGSVANSKTQDRLDQHGLTLDIFPPGKCIPVVYVRYIAEVDMFYIGQTQDLRHRYNIACLDQVLYAEIVPDLARRLEREQELIRDFEEAGLSLVRHNGIYDRA